MLNLPTTSSVLVFIVLLEISFIVGAVDSQARNYIRIIKRGEGYELKIPNVSNPNGGKAPNTLDEQIEANLKYLNKLQDDMDRQVNKVNTEFINQQPFQPENVNKSKKYPINLPEPELEKLLPISNQQDHQKIHQSAPFNLPSIVHQVLDQHNVPITQRSRRRKDLIGNMNIKGNMDQLKKLMKSMSEEVAEANKAISDRNKKKQQKSDSKAGKQQKQ